MLNVKRKNLRTIVCCRLLLGILLAQMVGSSSLNAEVIAGRDFSRSIGQDFSFDPPYGDFAAITFNPISQTYFVTDNKLDAMFEIQANGTLIRTIQIGSLKRNDIATADVEGIAWMYGQTFALALHDGKEIAVVTLTPSTTSIPRSQAAIYTVSSKPKGLTYVGSEDALYWIEKDAPKAVVKARINTATGQLDTLWTKNVDNLPAADLSDVAIFPRLTNNILLASETAQTIMEVDLSGATPQLRSSFALSNWPIPQVGGMTFGADGKMYVVGKHVSSTPEDDFNVFVPTGPIANRPPIALIASVLP